MVHSVRRVAFAGSALVLAALATCASASTVKLTIENHKFTPSEIHVKANEPSEFTIVNKDGTVAEFDSTSLKVEMVVSGNADGNLRVRPLAPGRYPFMGEFHSDTAEGVVIAD